VHCLQDNGSSICSRSTNHDILLNLVLLIIDNYMHGLIILCNNQIISLHYVTQLQICRDKEFKMSHSWSQISLSWLYYAQWLLVVLNLYLPLNYTNFIVWKAVENKMRHSERFIFALVAVNFNCTFSYNCMVGLWMGQHQCKYLKSTPTLMKPLQSTVRASLKFYTCIHSNNRRVGVTSTQGVFQLCLLLKLSMLAVFVYFCCVLTFEIHAVTLKWGKFYIAPIR
jgi:hypothetical protein